MKKPIILLFGLVGVLLVVGAVVFWPARTVPKSSSRQTIKYDPVKNVTYVTKDGNTFCIAGNLTNGTAWRQTRQAANQSPEPKNQLHCNLIQACGGNARLPKGRAFSFSCKKTSHDFSCARISVISFSSKTMHAVESASDSAAVSVKAQARFCRRAGSPVRGSKKVS